MKSGLSYISERTNQLRYSNKETREEWIQQLSSYYCLVPIKRGQAVSIVTPKDIEEVEGYQDLGLTANQLMDMTETFVVPTNTSRHKYCVGIALETVESNEVYKNNTFNLVPIHIQNIGRFVYDTYTVDDKGNALYEECDFEEGGGILNKYYIPEFLLDYKKNIGKTVWVNSNVDHDKKCYEAENQYGTLTIKEEESFSAYNNIIKIGHIADARLNDSNVTHDVRNIGSIEIQIEGDTRGLVDSTQFEATIGEDCLVPLKSDPDNINNKVVDGADLPIRVFALGQNEDSKFEFEITQKSLGDGFVGIQSVDGKTVIATINNGLSVDADEDKAFKDIPTLMGYELITLNSAYGDLENALKDCIKEFIQNGSFSVTETESIDNQTIYHYTSTEYGGYYYVYFSTSLRENGNITCRTISHGSLENEGKAVLADVRIPERQNIIGIYNSNIFDENLFTTDKLVKKTALFVRTGLINLPENFKGKFDIGKTYYLGANGTITTNPFLNLDRIIKIGFAQSDRKLVLDILSNDNFYNDDIPVGYMKPSVRGVAEYGFVLMDGVTEYNKETYKNLYSRCKNMFSPQDLDDENSSTFKLPKITYREVDESESGDERVKDYPCQIKYLADSVYNGVAFPRELCKKDWGTIGYEEVGGSLQEKINSINYPINDIDVTDLMTYGPNWDNSAYGINIEDITFSMFVDISDNPQKQKWTLLTPGFHLYNNTEYFGYTYTIFKWGANDEVNGHKKNHYYLRILTSGKDDNNEDVNVLGICYQQTPFSPPQSLSQHKYKIMLIRREPYVRQFDLNSLIISGGLTAGNIDDSNDKLVNLGLLKETLDSLRSQESSSENNSEDESQEDNLENPQDSYVLAEDLTDSVVSIMANNTSDNANKLQNIQVKKFVEDNNTVEATGVTPDTSKDFIPTINIEEIENGSKYVSEQGGNKKTLYGYVSNGGTTRLSKLLTNKVYRSNDGSIVDQKVTDSTVYQYTFGESGHQIKAIYNINDGAIHFQNENGQPIDIYATLQSSSSIQYKEIAREFYNENVITGSIDSTKCNDVPNSNHFGKTDNVSALQALHELPLAVFKYKNEADTKKRYFGIITERLNQLLQALNTEKTTKISRKVEIGSDNYKTESGTVTSKTIDMGVDYEYSNEQLDYIIKQLYMLTNNNENAQNIISSIGLLFQSAKETQDRLLALEASTFGADSPTIPGNTTLPNGWNSDVVAPNADGQGVVITNKINQIPTVYGLNRLVRALCGEIFGDYNPKALSGVDNTVDMSRIDYLHKEICGENYENYDEGDWGGDTAKEIDSEASHSETYPYQVTPTTRNDAYITDNEDSSEDPTPISQNELDGSSENFKETTIENFADKVDDTVYAERIENGLEQISENGSVEIVKFDGINDAINRICKKLNQLTININGDNNINRRPVLIDRLRDNIETLIREVFDDEYEEENGEYNKYVDNGELNGLSYKKQRLSRIDATLKDLFNFKVKSYSNDVTFYESLPPSSNNIDELIDLGQDTPYKETRRQFNGKQIKVNVNHENPQNVNEITSYTSVPPEKIGDFQYATVIDIIVDLLIGNQVTQKQLVRGNSEIDEISDIDDTTVDSVMQALSGSDGQNNGILGNSSKRSKFRRQESILERIKQIECVLDYIVSKFDNIGIFEKYGRTQNDNGQRALQAGSSYSNISSLDDFMNWIAGYTGVQISNASTRSLITNPKTDNSKFEDLLNVSTNTHLHNAVYDIAARLRARELGYEETSSVLGTQYELRSINDTYIQTEGLKHTSTDSQITLNEATAGNQEKPYSVSSDVSALLKMVYGTDATIVEAGQTKNFTKINHFDTDRESTSAKREDFVQGVSTGTYNNKVSNIEYLYDELYNLPDRYHLTIDEDGSQNIESNQKVIIDNTNHGIFGDPIYNSNCDNKSVSQTYYDMDNVRKGSFLKYGDPDVAAKLNNGNIKDFKGDRRNRLDVIEDALISIRKYLGMNDFNAKSKFTGDINKTGSTETSFKIDNSIKNGSTRSYRNTWDALETEGDLVISDNIKISNNEFNPTKNANQKLSVSEYIAEIQREINLLSDQVEFGFPENFRESEAPLCDITFETYKMGDNNVYIVPSDIGLTGDWYYWSNGTKTKIDDNHKLYVTISNYGGSSSDGDNEMAKAIIQTSAGDTYYLDTIYNEKGDIVKLYGVNTGRTSENLPLYIITKKRYSWNKVGGLLERVKALENSVYGYYTLQNNDISDYNEGFEYYVNQISSLESTAYELQRSGNRFSKNYTYVIKDTRDLVLWLLGIKEYYTQDDTDNAKELDYSHILIRRNTEEGSNGVYDLDAITTLLENGHIADLGIQIVPSKSAIVGGESSIDNEIYYIVKTTENLPLIYDTDYLLTLDNLDNWVLDRTKKMLKLHTALTDVWTLDFEDSADPIIVKGWFGFDGAVYEIVNDVQTQTILRKNTLEKFNLEIDGTTLPSTEFELFKNFEELKDLKVLTTSGITGNANVYVSIKDCPYIRDLNLKVNTGNASINADSSSSGIVNKSKLSNSNIVAGYIKIEAYNAIESCYFENLTSGGSVPIISSCRNINNVKFIEPTNYPTLVNCENISNIDIKVNATNSYTSYLMNTCSNITNVKINFAKNGFTSCKNIDNVIFETATGVALNECESIHNILIDSDNGQSISQCKDIYSSSLGACTVQWCKTLSSVKAKLFRYCEKLYGCELLNSNSDELDMPNISGTGFIYCQDLDDCRITTLHSDNTKKYFGNCTNMRNCLGRTDEYSCTVQKFPSFLNYTNLTWNFPQDNINAYNLANNTANGGWNYIENI